MSNNTVKHYRELFAEGNDVELKLTDDQIMTIVGATARPETGDADNDEDAFDTAVIIEMELQNGLLPQDGDDTSELPAVEPSNQEIVDAVNAAADENKKAKVRTAVFADRVSHDETFNTQVTAYMDATELVKSSALQIMFSLQRIYGADMADFPVPGSKAGTTGNRPSDQYATVVVKTDGGKKQGFGYYYNDFFSATEVGAKLDNDINAIKLAIDKAPNAPVELMKLRPAEKRQLRNKLEQRRVAGRGLIKRAVNIYLQAEKMKSLPKLRLSYSMKDTTDIDEATGETRTKRVFNDGTSFPIIISEVDDASQFEVYNVQQFLSLNIDKAATTTNGTLDDLITASQRSGAEPDATGTAKAAIKDLTQFEDVAANLVRYLEKDGTREMFIRRFSNKKDGDDFILLVGDLIDAIDPVWHHIEADYKKLSRARKIKQDKENANKDRDATNKAIVDESRARLTTTG